MYDIHRENNISILYRIRKSDGNKSEVCRIINTGESKLLIIDKQKMNSYIVKSENQLAKLKLAGSTYIGSFASDINIYIRPHYQEFHKEIMRQNARRYFLTTAGEYDTVELDYDSILDNMLECIASI